MEPLLVGLPRRCLNAYRCRHSSYNHLGNTSRFELAFQIRCCERTPASLRDDNIARLPDPAPAEGRSIPRETICRCADPAPSGPAPGPPH